MAGGRPSLSGLAPGRGRLSREPRERDGIAVQRRRRGGRKLGDHPRVAASGQPGEDVVVDPAVRVERVDAQPCGQALHDSPIRAEHLGERVRLGAAVAREQCRARPAVEHQGAQPVGVAGSVREGDATAVARGIELDVADSELGPDCVEVGRGGAGAVGVAPVADATREPAAAGVHEHDVTAVAQRVEQCQQRRAVARRGHAVAACADQYGVAGLGAPAVGVELEPDAHGAGCRIGGDQWHRDRAAAGATGAGAQVGGPSSCGEHAGRRDCHHRDPRARRGYQRSPHPAQLGSHRCSKEMCGAPVSSARRKERWRRTKPKRS